MNSFELNKILGAILGTCLITLALNIGASAIFAPEKPAKPGFNIAVKEQAEGEKAGAAKEPDPPVETLLAKASSSAKLAIHLRKVAPIGLAPICGIS
jgi:cytochrome c